MGLTVRSSRVALVALALLLCASACGATKPDTGTGRDISADREVLTAPDGKASGSKQSATSGASSRAGTAAGAPVTAGSPTRSASGRPVALGRGVSASSIAIGFFVYDARVTNTAISALGIRGATFGDTRAAAAAVVKHLNDRGGIAGRRIEPVYVEYYPDREFRPQYQRACAVFTEDHEVFAVVSQIDTPGVELLSDCLKRRETVLLHDLRLALDRTDLDPWRPYVYSPGTFGAHRWGGVIDEFVAAHYFDDGAKLGIAYMDTASARRVLRSVLKPRLAHHGVRPVAEVAVDPFYSFSELGALAIASRNAVLRMRQAGATHVLFFNSWGAIPLFFTSAAEDQGYRPRYALTTSDLPHLTAQNAPGDQLRRAVAVGWWPGADVPVSRFPRDNPALNRCMEIHRKAGIAIETSPMAIVVLMTCDGAFMLEHVLTKVRSFTAPGLRDAVDRLGSAFRSPATFSTRFVPGRSDGVAAVRRLTFDLECRCFSYRGTAARV